MQEVRVVHGVGYYCSWWFDQDARAIRGAMILCGVVVVRVKEAKQAGGFL